MSDTSSPDKYLFTAGHFVCKVEKPMNGWLAEMGGNNTPCVTIPLTVCEGPFTGKRITYYAWLSPNALNRSLKTLAECFGFNGDFEMLAKDPLGFAEFKCRVVTAMEIYKGRLRCFAKWLNPMGSETVAAPGDDNIPY